MTTSVTYRVHKYAGRDGDDREYTTADPQIVGRIRMIAGNRQLPYYYGELNITISEIREDGDQ